MKYHDIQKVSLTNGEGIRTVLWVSGCDHCCPGCQNPVTWDPDDGLEFNDRAMDELITAVSKNYCDGLTLSGGDPLYVGNRKQTRDICEKVKAVFEKLNRKPIFFEKHTIWLYTGYTMKELEYMHDKDVDAILDCVDVVVDGPYIEAERNTQRFWCGSDNQLVWRKKNGIWKADPKEYVRSLSEERHEKERGCDC